MATDTSFRQQIALRQPDYRGRVRRGFRWSKLRFEWYRVCSVVHPVQGIRDVTWVEWELDRACKIGPRWLSATGFRSPCGYTSCATHEWEGPGSCPYNRSPPQLPLLRSVFRENWLYLGLIVLVIAWTWVCFAPIVRAMRAAKGHP